MGNCSSSLSNINHQPVPLVSPTNNTQDVANGQVGAAVRSNVSQDATPRAQQTPVANLGTARPDARPRANNAPAMPQTIDQASFIANNTAILKATQKKLSAGKADKTNMRKVAALTNKMNKNTKMPSEGDQCGGAE